jgi:predicted RNase H-like HicB family nuclease
MDLNMRFFNAVVHKEEGSAFGIHFPQLPGCFSAADRREDLIPNATEALALWFEGSEFEGKVLPCFASTEGFLT